MSVVMPKISPCLAFNNQAEEAVAFYVAAFDNAAILNVTRFGPNDYGPEGSVRTIRFHLGGQEMIAVNGGPSFQFSQGISLYVTCDTQAEVDRLWQRLSAGGKPEVCGWLVDKFGISWQIAPANAWPLTNDSDPDKSLRVIRAIEGMTILDAAAIQQAFDGR